MRRLTITTSLAALALAGACSGGSDAKPDDALRNDLALAAQTQPYTAQQFVSPTERQLAGTGYAPQYAAAPRAPQPVYRAPARRTSRASRSAGTYSAPAPAPQREVIKHTGRDAAIGAAAGAVIGASTSQDRVKGGLIGAAAGGLLGAIIGNNVDVQRP